jgi:hypothetical protein
MVVLTNAFLIDCTGSEPMVGAAVVVEDGRVKDVLPTQFTFPFPKAD